MIIFKSRLDIDLLTIPYVVALPMYEGRLYKVIYRGPSLRLAYERMISFGGEILTRTKNSVINEINLAMVKEECKYVVVHVHEFGAYGLIYAGGNKSMAKKGYNNDKEFNKIFKDKKEITYDLL